MRTAAPGLIIEHGDARPVIEVAATVRPEIGTLGFSLAEIELLHRRLLDASMRLTPAGLGRKIAPDNFFIGVQ